MAEITFKADKKHRDKYFSSGSFAHPAKMMLPLQRWLIERYSKPGEVILDPMAGQGTLLIACTTGRHVITVELETKFIQMQRDNWAKIQTLGPEMGFEMGTATILQGNARKLPDVLAGVVISSPPYEGSEARDRGKEQSFERELSGKYPKRGDLNISKGYQGVDAVISSPPYESALGHDGGEGPLATSNNREDCAIQADRLDTKPGYTNGREPKNIGNLKGQSYLSAMLEVYQGCWRVLKPQGLMCFVTKNFMRNKQEVRLDLDTIKLGEQAGFGFVERHYRKLTSQSFWRTIYRQKYPDAPILDKEDILVLRWVKYKRGCL